MPIGIAVGEVHHELHQKIAADPGGRVVDGLRALLEIASPGKLDEAVAEVLPLEQHEDHEDHHQARRGERREQRTDDGLDDLERLSLRRLRACTVTGSCGAVCRVGPGVCCWRLGLFFAGDLLAEVLDGGGDLLDDAAAAGADCCKERIFWVMVVW